MQCGLHVKKNNAQTSLDIHQIYTWICTPIIHVKNTRGKHVKQNQVAFFTLYPSDIHVNGYIIKPVVTCESRMCEPVAICSALQSQNAVSPYL